MINQMNSRAIFLGSFNPPHQGHVNCIKSVIESDIMERLNIVKIHVIPCWQNPNKIKSIDFYDRYKMCKYEFASLPYDCLVDDIEASIKPTYTYELIDYFYQGKDEIIGPNFWWIITIETYCEILNGKWKESEHILNTNKFILVYKNYDEILSLKYKYPNIDFNNVVLVQLKYFVDAHSTQIRENFWVNAKYDSYIMKDTKDYIIEHNLYK